MILRSWDHGIRRQVALAWTVLLALGLLLACGGGGASTAGPPPSGGTGPSNLVYPATVITGTVGQAVPPLTPTVTGTVDTFTIQPALPQGLILEAATGRISGTPLTYSPVTTYTVTARNASGSTSTTLQISVAATQRLIHISGQVPTLAQVIASRSTLEQAPFDGLVCALQAGRVAFRTAAYSSSSLDADRANAPLVNSAKLTDNFLLMRGGAESGFDRLSDTHWATAIQNVRAFAQVAKLGNFKGIAFDPEAYPSLGQSSLFDYRTYDSGTLTFQACQANLRLRGQQVMSAIQQEYPGSVVFLFGGLCLLRNGTTQFVSPSNFPTHRYGLLPDFLNGMLDVLAPGMVLVDGGEASYVFYRSTWYSNLRTLVLTTGQSLLDSANRSRYQNQLEMGLSVYFDATFDMPNDPGLIAHWLSPSDRPGLLNYQVFWGFLNASRYVWIYAEGTNWVTRTNIPAGAEAAMIDAKVKASGGLPLGTDIEPKLQAAAAAGGLEW